MSDLWSDRLSEYLDGDLAARDVTALEAHLDGCLECSRTLDALREISARAQALEDRLPDQDLWPSIRGRIAAVPRRRIFELPSFGLPRHFRFTLPQAVAAGLALMLISGGSVWWALRHGAPVSTGSSSPATGQTATRAPGGAPGVSQAPAPAPNGVARSAGVGAQDAALSSAALDTNYDQAIAELENTLTMHRAELDTSTVRIVEQNLAIIDRAIVQARRALAADPASPYLHQHLALQMKLKLDLLRRTTALAGAQG